MNIPIRAAARRHLRWYSILGWSLLGLLGAAFVVYTLTVSLGAVHGVEFCPQTFDRRSYSFFEIPFVRRQVTGVRRESLTKTAELFLQTKNLIVPPGGKREWHLVQGTHGPQPPRHGDAAILIKYLDATDSKDIHRWIKWSEDHAELAKVFWPAVQKLAIYDLYVFLPDLFEIAKTTSDVKLLKSKLDDVTAQRFLFLARRLADAGTKAGALAAIDEAAALQPASAEIKALQNELRAEKP